MSDRGEGWEPAPPDAEPWEEHPEREPEWGDAWVARAAEAAGTEARMWHWALEEGFIGPEEGDWREGEIEVGTAALMRAVGVPPAAGRPTETRFGLRLRAMFPGARSVRRRPRGDKSRLEYAYRLPRLDECRAGFVRWLDAGRRAGIPAKPRRGRGRPPKWRIAGGLA